MLKGLLLLVILIAVFVWAVAKSPNKIVARCVTHPNTPIIRSDDPRFLEEFPGARRLREAFPIIQEEAAAVLNTKADGDIKKDLFFKRISPQQGGWTRFRLRWHGKFTKEALRLCPRTCEILREIGSDTVPIAMFSILKPGNKILPHRGPFKGCWRYHLGLRVPDPETTPGEDRPAITVEGEAYRWVEGEDVLFDDTFIHSVNYPKTRLNMERNIPRVILFADIQRTGTSKVKQKVLNGLTKTLGPLSAKLNKLNEKITR